jgi:hypothetical protein
MIQITKISKKVLVVSRSSPNPIDGSTMHMDDFLQYLKNCKYEVHYLALCVPKTIEIDKSCVDITYFPESHEILPIPYDSLVNEREQMILQNACDKAMPAVVIADYSWLGGIFDNPFFRLNPLVKKMIFVHDLRVKILPSYVKMGILRAEHNTWTNEIEGELLSKANVAITLNDQDKNLVQEIAPKVHALKMGMSVAPKYIDKSAVIANRCIYVASNCRENIIAILWILKFVWPLVSKEIPSASLMICGSIGEKLKENANSDPDFQATLVRMNILLVGRVENLTQHYALAQIAIIPHWMMGGIKIKHIEAIAHGLPVVCTEAGADGLPEAINQSAFIADTPNLFAVHILRLFKNPHLLEEARKNSREISLRLTPEIVYQEVGQYLI